MQSDDLKKKKTNTNDFLFKEDFKYKHDNPYHDKLGVFDKFVLRDNEGEENKGSWKEKEFKNKLPIELEIGTGYGHFMLSHIEVNTNINFIGVDHRFKRSYNLAKKLNTVTNENFRYLRARGERLSHLFSESELNKIYYFFPDPWPKNRHHKKRLFQKSFIDQAYEVLEPAGQILIKTDHDEYFDWMLKEIEGDKRFEMTLKTFDLREEHPDHFLASFITKFERIFLDKGTKIKAMVLKSLKN